MTTLADVRAGVSTALESIDDLAVHTGIGAPRNAPFAIVRLTYADAPLETMSDRGIVVVDCRTQVYVSTEGPAQDRLDEYLTWSGEQSVKHALDSDQSLGGVADSVLWTGAEELGVVEVDGISYLAGEVRHTVRLQKEPG